MSKKEKFSKYFVGKLEKETFLALSDEYLDFPVNFIEFCLSDEFMGLGDDIFDSVLNIGQEFYEKNVLEIILLAGIGGGKSFLAQLLLAHTAHRLLCLKDPHDFYGLSKDKPIVLINMGLSATQAKNVVFAGLVTLIKGSPWFNDYIDEKHINKTEVTFKRPLPKNLSKTYDILMLFSGNSKEEAPIGMNLFGAVLDEAAFYLSNDDKDQAQLIYDSCKARITSRFGDKGGWVCPISSPKWERDFISQKKQEGELYPDRILARSMPTWKMKDRDKMNSNVFIFNPLKMQIEEVFPVVTEEEKKTLTFAKTREKCKHLWIIPTDFKDDFQRRPEKSIRDLGANPTSAIDAFIKIPKYIDDSMGLVRNRAKLDGTIDLSNPPSEMIFIHLDFGLNRKKKNGGSGDLTGFAACRCVGIDEVSENRPIVQFDIVKGIEAGEGGEVKFSEVRAIIIAMKKAGWKIMKVTIDGWQSIDTIQILNARGILCEYLSVDTSVAPYESLKDGLYDNRVLLPNVPLLARELKELEFVRGEKVDHPPHGSKDIADAVSGAFYNCVKNHGIRSEVEYNMISSRRR